MRIRKTSIPLWIALALLLPHQASWGATGRLQDEDPHDHGDHNHAYAPLGVMGGHVHEAGEFMFSYRFMRMDMDGMRDGTSDLSSADVFAAGFPVTPTEMTMDMHMFGAMYAASDDLTFMLMLPWLDVSMDHRTMGGVSFTTRSEGIGDTKLSGLYTFWRSEHHSAHVSAGISLPTGSINAKDTTPASGGVDVRLPYPMQLGSGTYDLLPGATLLGECGPWSWGAQGNLTLRLGENDHDYTLGDRIDLTTWIGRELQGGFSTSFRVAGSRWGNIDGADQRLNAAMVPTADPDRQAGTRIDALIGLDWRPNEGRSPHRLAIEIGAPVFQDLDGPQLETDSVLTVGWQYGR